ncbi:hypothetical protein [Streptomyces sp. NPDC057545]|uniref:hypothetical protein n=1 Tax=unclassified Streptomyces TaxID=2593676 RepID=UPI0036C50237
MGQNEPGVESSPLSSAVMGGLGALGAISPIGAVAQTAVGDLVTELSSFTKFRERIEEILRDLKASPAGPHKVGEERASRDHFGGVKGEWPEADGLYTSYSLIIKELETLSKLLSDSIEGLSIAVLGAHKGYQNLDEDIRDRMDAIKRETQAHYHGEYNPVPDEGKHAGKQPAPAKPDGDTAGTGDIS